MKPVQQQMLESLGSGVRPVELGERAIDLEDYFDTMLTRAVQGRARTDLGVSFAPGASGMFDPVQQEQIARAVDIAAAAGSERALILHDRHTLRVDVRNRVVIEAPIAKPGDIGCGIDAFVCAHVEQFDGDTVDSPPGTTGLLVPARIVRNASLARTLAQASGASDTEILRCV